MGVSAMPPGAYGLGESGWVTVEPAAGQMPSLDLLKSWIDESYRTQAPKKLAAGVAGRARSTRTKTTARSQSGRA